MNHNIRNDRSIHELFQSDIRPVKSASYNRMKSYMYDHETITLTADKSQRTGENYNGITNKEFEIILRNKLRELCSKHGWKVIPVYGGYQGSVDKSEINENSYMIINMTDDKDFRQVMNNFMKEFDSNFDIEFKQESIMYSPALGKQNGDKRTFEGQGEWDYPSTNEDSFKLGNFRDKSKGVDRNDAGEPQGYFYTKPRRYKSHSFAFGDDYVSDR